MYDCFNIVGVNLTEEGGDLGLRGQFSAVPGLPTVMLSHLLPPSSLKLIDLLCSNLRNELF